MKLGRILGLLLIAASFMFAHTFKLADTIKGAGPMVKEFNAECHYYEQFVNYITPDELKKWMDEDWDFTIVDVRSVDEMKGGEIDWPDYDEYPRGDVAIYAAMGGLKKNNVYVFVCATGHRAVLAGGELVKWFHFLKKDIYVLRGGINGWLNCGYPVVNKVTEFGGFKGLKKVGKVKEPVILDQF
jgi:rhodanese-related sulfurtransferase